MAAAERYMTKLSEVIKPFLITKGGPILMLQIENEYGSYGNEKEYLQKLKDIWISLGIDVPTFTGDGPTTTMLSAGTLAGKRCWSRFRELRKRILLWLQRLIREYLYSAVRLIPAGSLTGERNGQNPILLQLLQ